MNNSIVFFANTFGVFLFVISVELYLVWAQKKEVALHAALSVLIAGVTTIILKELFLTPRPFEVNNIDPLAGLAYLSSFPSSHTAVAFALATSVALHQTKLGIFLMMIAALVGIGRVAGSVHYPVDIAFGVLIGVTIALFWSEVHIRLQKSKKRSIKS